MQKTLTCIICPVGCEITVTGIGKTIEKIEGNECKRGIQYATDEFTDPRRILTTTVKIDGANLPVVSVRSDKPLPKNIIFNCMEVLKKVCIQAPVKMGQVVIENILDTGVNIITTRC
jgi:CxxC motif-containing protein